MPNTYKTHFLKLERDYNQTCRNYPNSPSATGWYSRETQEKRFEILAKIVPLQGLRILDVGCGQGHLFGWLKQQAIPVTYTGIDLSQAMINYARVSQPHARFIKTNLFDFKEPVDIVIASGAFNNKTHHHLDYITLAIQHLRTLATTGIAFNLLSSETPLIDQDTEAFTYFSPKQIATHFKKTLHLQNAEQLTIVDNYLPNDFTVYVSAPFQKRLGL